MHFISTEERDIFQWGWERGTILYFLKVEVFIADLLPNYQYQNNTETSQILSKVIFLREVV